MKLEETSFQLSLEMFIKKNGIFSFTSEECVSQITPRVHLNTGNFLNN